MKIAVLISLIYISSAQAYKYTKETCINDMANLITDQLKGFFKNLTAEPGNLYLRFYDRKNPDGIILSKSKLYKLIQVKRETKILVSGWIEGHDVEWITKMKDIYVKSTSHNVIIYDYDEYAFVPYFYAVSVSQNVGTELGNFIVDLVKKINLDLKKVHIIGHSMGSHVAGFAGKQIYQRLKRKVGRITGLDAAGPIFNLNPTSTRLSVEDAEFVDAIHTNDYFFGFSSPYATVDIYVENTILQADCSRMTEHLLKFGVSCALLQNYMFCSHRMSNHLWMKTITSTKLHAHSISNLDEIIVGEHCPRNAQGVYQFEGSSL